MLNNDNKNNETNFFNLLRDSLFNIKQSSDKLNFDNYSLLKGKNINYKNENCKLVNVTNQKLGESEMQNPENISLYKMDQNCQVNTKSKSEFSEEPKNDPVNWIRYAWQLLGD